MKFFHRSRAWRRDALVAFIARPERTAIYNNEKPHTRRPLNRLGFQPKNLQKEEPLIFANDR